MIEPARFRPSLFIYNFALYVFFFRGFVLQLIDGAHELH